MSFVHLHTHSHYSLLDGLAKIPELVKEAERLEMPALALTDHGNLYGAIEFYKTAAKAGIKPIIGMEAYIAARTMHDKQPGIDDKRSHLLLLAETNEGYQNLIHLVTKSNLEGFYYKPRVDKNLLRRHSKGLIATSACLSGEIPKALVVNDWSKAEKLTREYQEIFGKDNFFIELEHHPGVPNHANAQQKLRKLAKDLKIPVVAGQDIHYLKPDDSKAHDVLLAVQTNSKLDDEDRLTLKDDNFSFRSPEEMEKLFKDIPEAVENTKIIADRVNTSIELGNIQLPYFEAPKEYSSQDKYLEALCKQGLKTRYGKNITSEIKKRLDYELDIIKKTDFAPYFLIVQDFVNWAKKQGIIVGPGRGSVCGSLIAYLLNITDVDPIKYNLIFERFMNPARISPPDIDLDFADTRRDEVIDYVAEKYGKDHVAQIITFGTMAARAAIRDAGRALGLSYDFCDQIAKMIPFGKDLSKTMKLVPEFKQAYETSEDTKKLIDAAKKLEGVARHASVHACGVVITKDPLTNSVPLQYAVSRNKAGEKEQAIVSQYEMHSVEDLGLLKMDFLGLKNLSIIEATINLVKERRGKDIDIHKIDLEEEGVFKMLSEGKTVGIFQLEGQGMTKYLMDMKPTRLEDIIAMIALYRPGPIELIPRYIERKHGKEKITYLHPKMEPILDKTYGVMTYQEQLMQVAQALAGFSLSEADILRKAVGKKIKKLLAEQREKFIAGVQKTTGSKSLGEKVWALIEPFGGYGFNKSHSAGYALIAYQTAYLKYHYPLEFMTSLMTADEKDVERASFLVKECGKIDIEVLPPDINQSDEHFSPHIIGGEKAIRFGLTGIKNVGHNVVSAIINERKTNGPYRSLAELLDRIPTKEINKKSLEALIMSGALDGLGERKQMLENMQEILMYHKDASRAHSQNQSSLFGLVDNESSLPSLRLKQVEPASFDEKLRWEKELLGLYLSGHPLDKFKGKIENKKMNIKAIKSFGANAPVMLSCMVEEIKKIMTKNGEPMAFIKLLDFTDSIEAVVFPRTLKEYGHLIEEEAGLVIKGKVSHRNNIPSIIVDEARPIEI